MKALIDGLGDPLERAPDAHEANLYDVDAKYGDVVSVEETLEYLEKVREETGAPS